MKIVFMGTPDFAAVSLQSVIEAGHQVGLVVTQPDKARDRGKKVQLTPVKELAIAHDIPVLQPERIKNSPETLETIKAYGPDIIIVAAYGQIIPKTLLELPPLGCINVHASLLPKLRGAAPIQRAILDGETETGITIMQMNEGLDTGDMLAKAITPIGQMNYEQLHDKLAILGGELLAEVLPWIKARQLAAASQDEEEATYAPRIMKQDGKIDFNKSAEEIERQIRAFDPWPGAFCSYMGKTMKIWQARVLESQGQDVPGKVLSVSDEGVDIACGSGILRVLQIQMPGKKRVSVKDFLRGNHIEEDCILE
ncbi:methionyl-tRNA formyltransferase [Ihubacter sp. rT4E-8]|uniref:methionyl-tRNA formyltransferase n=1 Tax=Ihubacter sp. rT4E-8 TaxID=3242369 RepID=UPI001379E1A2